MLQDEKDEIAERLDSMPREEFPPALKLAILKELRRRTSWRTKLPASATAEGGRRHTLRRAWVTAAWATAAAMILAIVIVDRQRLTDTGATMAPRATLLVQKTGDAWTLEPVVPGPRPTAVSIGWDPAKVEIVGVSDDKEASFDAAGARFILREPSQHARVTVRPRGANRAAEIRILAGDDEVLRRVVHFE